jgi:hypothetical protein
MLGHLASTASGGGALAIRRDWRRRRICWYIFNGCGHEGEPMAKGQRRSTKEAKKPKANKPKTSVSGYKKSVIASGHK